MVVVILILWRLLVSLVADQGNASK